MIYCTVRGSSFIEIDVNISTKSIGFITLIIFTNLLLFDVVNRLMKADINDAQ